MNTLPEFHPGQPAHIANTALKTALGNLEKAEQCSVLWFSEILKRKLFKELGFSSMNQYAEIELGFSSSRTGYFIKLCKDLKGLPKFCEKVVSGELGWTKARVITTITDESNQEEMLDFALKNSRRDIEEMVKTKKSEAKEISLVKVSGQPSLLPEPKAQNKLPRAAVPVRVNLEMSPIQFAKYEVLWEKLRKKKNLPAGKVDALLEIMTVCLNDTSLEKTTRVAFSDSKGNHGNEKPQGLELQNNQSQQFLSQQNQPPIQLHIHQCPDCAGATIQTSKGELEVGNVALEQALCDCQISRPKQRNTTSIPPATRRKIMEQARYKCQRSGCHHTQYLEIHHIVARSNGGTNEVSNLTCLCSACHKIMHENVQAVEAFLVKEKQSVYRWNPSGFSSANPVAFVSNPFEHKSRLKWRTKLIQANHPQTHLVTSSLL